MLKIGVGTVALLGILIGSFALWNRSKPTPPPETPIASAPVELIADIWYPAETLEYTFDTRYNLLLLLDYNVFYKQMSSEQLEEFNLRWEEVYGVRLVVKDGLIIYN